MRTFNGSVVALSGAIVLFAFSACGNKKDDGAAVTGAAEAVDDGKGEASADVRAKGKRPAAEVPSLADIKTMYSAGMPMPAGLLGKIALGVTPVGDAGSYLFGYPPKKVAPEVVLYAIRGSGKKDPRTPIVSVAIEMTGATGAAALATATAAWGKPIDAADNSGTKINGKELDAHYWWNPEEHIYAKLIEGTPAKFTLSYHSYLPLAELMGPGRDTFGFEAEKPLLGASVEELAVAYVGRYKSYGKNGKLTFLGTEFQHVRSKTTVHWVSRDGVVTEYRFSIRYGVGPGDGRKRFLDAMEKKFGKPTEEAVAKQTHLVFKKSPRVSMFDQVGVKSFDVTVKSTKAGPAVNK